MNVSPMFDVISVPTTSDQRPERKDVIATRMEEFVHGGIGLMKKCLQQRAAYKKLVAQINLKGEKYRQMSDAKLRQELAQLRTSLIYHGLIKENVSTSFSLIREFSHRVLTMRHYDCQLIGGLVLLEGKVAEMETGEGKTLTATLPAVTMALAGVPVHVISVNDYLTHRDAENMGPLYRAMGVSTGCVIHGITPQKRKLAYLADITYVTNKELVFDYLRDRLILGNRIDATLLQSEYLHSREQRSQKILLRGLHYGIVDEADSILIDEARTPLIISGPQGGDERKQFLEQALMLAQNMKEEEDYVVDRALKILRITAAGKKYLEQEAPQYGSLWNGLVRRESTVQQALTALHFFHRNEQYIIRDGKVQIVDEFTGRVMEDRAWEQGLHQLIELKEGCPLTERRETLAKISYQRFFRRYLRLAGMTGTAKEVAGELWSVYHLQTVKIAPNRPMQRKKLATRIFASAEQKWQVVVQRIKELHGQGRPVLVGTHSVATSEKLSKLVKESNLSCRVLNAKQDAQEAEIISSAGKMGAITIATNMAGRGTDILLGRNVRERGGLHVIITELHEAARIDRQLAGRCGRQGDPGTFEAILSFDDVLFQGREKGLLVKVGKYISTQFSPQRVGMTSCLMNFKQKRVERYHARVRKELFRQDQARSSLLSFAGQIE